MVENELSMNSVSDGESKKRICECVIIQMKQTGAEVHY